VTSPLGKQQRSMTHCAAGDICAVAKLGSAETSDTLSGKDQPLLMESWAMPEPLLPVAITAKSKADEDKMSQALSRLVAEDPTLRLENNAETHQLVLWCMGEAHADLLLDRLGSRYGVAVETVPLRVPLRETVGDKARAWAGTSSRPAGTASSASAISRWSRRRRRTALSSSTRSSAAWCRGSSSRRWRRASGPRWKQACW
jgi:elongation factor G